MNAEPIAFDHAGARLVGTLHLPSGPGPHPAVVVLHAASLGEQDAPFYGHLVSALPQAGVAVLLYDRRGSGHSSGDFETADFEALAGDGVAAAAAIAARPDIDDRRIGVYGVSQGAWLAPLVAVGRRETRCLVLVSASGVSPAEQMDYGTATGLRLAGYGEATVTRMLALRARVNAYYRGQARRQEVQAALEAARGEPWFAAAYLDGDLPEDVGRDKWKLEMDYDPLPVWARVTQPALFLFADHDRWVPVERSLEAYARVTNHLPSVTMVRVSGTDHLMGAGEEGEGPVSDEYVRELVGWLAEALRP